MPVFTKVRPMISSKMIYHTEAEVEDKHIGN